MLIKTKKKYITCTKIKILWFLLKFIKHNLYGKMVSMLILLPRSPGINPHLEPALNVLEVSRKTDHFEV